MMIRIAQPQAFSLLGGRTNNEDSLFPPEGEATSETRLFLVCDGIGGGERGEVASQLACESMASYMLNHPTDPLTETEISAALSYAEDQFDAYLRENPVARGMGTTMTLLAIHRSGITVAHAGDSRVYHWRTGQIQWQTRDHSLVNELFDAGVLTEDEALHFARKNVITRAILGKSVKPTRPDVRLIDDVQPGDYFLLCTDGVLEHVSSLLLETILGSEFSDEEKRNYLMDCCSENQDNSTAYLIRIESVEGDS